MEDSTTGEASIATENATIRPAIRTTGMSMVRKEAERTFPWSIAAELNLVSPPPTPSPSPSPSQDEDEDLPVAKRPRLHLVSPSPTSPQDEDLPVAKIHLV
jgi:hypothetical protein